MLQKFTPLAPDIIPLYIGILNLHPSDPFVLEKKLARIVDFFFEHLASASKEDDYLILRGKLIFIFTFLIGPSRHGDDLNRSQIYDLFRHEDAFLLLPFDEMKGGDLSHKKMINIDIATASIIQMYCGFSDSWIALEAERMDHMFFVSIQRELYSVEKNPYKERKKGTIYFSIERELSSTEKHANMVMDQVPLYKMELRFLRMFLQCFVTWDYTDNKIRVSLSSMITCLQEIWEQKGLFASRLHAIQIGDISNWHLLTSELVGKIQKSKLEIEAWWVNLFHCPFQCRPLVCNDALNKLDSILENLKDLVSYRAAKIVPFKKQIETLEEKLVFLKNLLKLSANCVDNKELEEFNMFVQVLTNDAACLTFLYWAHEEADDKIATETNFLLSHMLEKIKPGTPDVARLYFRTLEAIYMKRSDSFLFGQTALSFVQLFIEDLVTSLKHDFPTLEDDIIFLLTFLNDPPNDNAAELICCHMDVLFWDGVCSLVPFDDMKQDVIHKKVLLSDFVIKIQTVNVRIRHLYCELPDSSIYNFPMIVAPRFLDFLIENLRNLMERMINDRKYAPFAKHHIGKIVEELVSLRPFFNHIFELQNVLNDAWLQAVNLVHLTEHVIVSCISSWFVFDRPIWYHMTCLSDLFERIKVVKTMIENITAYSGGFISTHLEQGSFISTHLEQGRSSKINEVVVGLEDEAEKLIGMLTCGYMPLDIVSIVGMGGLGKTTIAKKVYGSSVVRCHFNIFAFRIVSQDHNKRRLLLDILRDIKGDDCKFSDMTDDGLAHQLWKCLSRQKYIIVLDDIWDIGVWNKVKSSFPNNKNGSRVMFTTQSHEVADKGKITSFPHKLRFLTDDESWELLQKRVFHNGISPPNLWDIGKLISRNCKGLPLSISVIAGLLAKTESNQSLWKEIASRVSSYLLDEGCMNILELSFKHLPEYLKPCLIYLGAYPQDWLIKVKQVALLWIAEGFVSISKIKSLEDVAKEYFYDLVDRSLVIVNTRSSKGEIKTFRVHDLIHGLCRRKCQEGKFFHVGHGNAASSSSHTSMCNSHRVSIENINDIIVDSGISYQHIRSLLFFHGVDYTQGMSVHLKDHRLAQVLHLEGMWQEKHIQELTSLVHDRHFEATIFTLRSIPSSIANLWNMQSLILLNIDDLSGVDFPETLWRMNSLRHVKVTNCKVKFSDNHDNMASPELDKVVSFSKPILSGGKDVEQLLQRLRQNSFPGQTLEMEDVAFENLIFFELHDRDLVQWNATTESFPCLEHLLIECERLEELPSCFGEISTLKSIVVRDSTELENSSLAVGEPQMEYGNEVEVLLFRRKGTREFEDLPDNFCDPFLRDFEENFNDSFEADFEGNRVGGTPLQHIHIPQLPAKSDLVPIKSQWLKGKLIGRGTFTSVYVASNKDRETGALCAVKEAEILHDDPTIAECIRQLEQEIQVLSHLKHVNIVQYFGSQIVGDRFQIYLEYVHPGSINNFIYDQCGEITETVVRNFTRHILSGLAYLHSEKTIHRDIKVANLLVDAYGVVKLAGFGMTKHLTGPTANLSFKGSPYWMAPELLQSVMQMDDNVELSFATDIWSLGCTIIEMLNGKRQN